MKIIKRDGREQEVSFDKIIDRIKYSSEGLSDVIESVEIAQKVISYVKEGIHTREIDEVTAKICMDMSIQHPDFQELASNIIISNHHKNTITGFSDKISILYKNRDHDGKPHPLVSKKLYRLTMKYKTQIDKMMDYERDFLFDYFGYKTLEKSYLMRLQTKEGIVVVERPQDMFMRVSLALHDDDLEQVQKSYNLLSQKYFTHASPTLFNAGSLRSQYASCFLLKMDDSMEGIYKCISDCANISKWAGGLGLCVSEIRGNGSLIRGTNGPSNGIVPMLRVLDATAVFANQGSRRKGAIAVYIEPHHPDILDFLDLRKNHGKEEQRARNLFTAIWLNDYFVECVRENKTWSLFCPDECPGLTDVYGEEYKELCIKYEAEGKARKTIKARDLWKAMIVSQIETGTPYMSNKDAANTCSNQKNIGTIKCSNLCVAGDTKILTESGYKPIQQLSNQKVSIWNGQEFSESMVCKTGVNQKMVKVTFSNGSELVCTPYHKFYIQTRYVYYQKLTKDILNSSAVEQIEAQGLTKGMKLVKCDFPVIDNKMELESAYTNGFFTGDGSYQKPNEGERSCNFSTKDGKKFCKRHENQYENRDDNKMFEKCHAVSYRKKPIVRLYHSKVKLLSKLDYLSHGQILDNSVNVMLKHNLQDKFFVPMEYSLKSKLEWFAGYVDADGTIINAYGIKSLQVACIHKDFLENVKLMLQTCGINPKIVKMCESGKRLLPDGRGGEKYFNTKEAWRLLIHASDMLTLKKLGFSPNRLNIEDNNTKQNSSKFITVSSVEELSEEMDTYCFNEPKRHAGIFNGVIAGNCNEIYEVSSSQEYAVCTLASLCLPTYVKDGAFDHEKLREVVHQVVVNLNKIIDHNFYPVKETKKSNLRHRPMGVGVQGLADVFLKLKLAYDSPEALQLNREIFETIYYAALEKSTELAVAEGKYETYEGSPLSQGQFQFDMWRDRGVEVNLSGRWDWEGLRERIMRDGVRNSLLVALMPTASTSQIMGNQESFEPYTSNVYSRKTLAGNFTVINKYLIRELIELGVWDNGLRQELIRHSGSVQSLDIPDDVKRRYKTIWEIKQKTLIDLSADRGPFVCQSQSLNLYFENPEFGKIHNALLYAHKRNLKTMSYYIRTRAASDAIQFTVEQNSKKAVEPVIEEIDDDEVCVSCSG